MNYGSGLPGDRVSKLSKSQNGDEEVEKGLKEFCLNISWRLDINDLMHYLHFKRVDMNLM